MAKRKRDSDTSILNECYLRTDSIFDTPFYQNETEQTATLDKINTPEQGLRLTRVMKALYKLPTVWSELFNYVPTKQTEIAWNNWTFLSLRNMEEKYELYSQKHWIDIAITYGGMGWVYVLCWDKDLKLWFIILTGGSSEWDVGPNNNYFIDNADTSLGFNSTHHAHRDKMMTFDEVIEAIRYDSFQRKAIRLIH